MESAILLQEVRSSERALRLDEHALENEDAPALYVGTYGKYNGGSIYGMWVDLTTFDCYDDFLEFCRFLHSDEEDPEFMFQDFMNFPEALYCECGINEEDFDEILRYYLLSDYEKRAFDAYCNNSDYADIDSFKEHFIGEYDSKEDFAMEIMEDEIDSRLGNWACYFDWKAYARDLFLEAYEYWDGFVFNMA